MYNNRLTEHKRQLPEIIFFIISKKKTLSLPYFVILATFRGNEFFQHNLNGKNKINRTTYKTCGQINLISPDK